ncbi:hypothetical protein N0V82_005850 [Gnomoniopsis sp. IMI 355080]|nr:hypothetical protein N0V82_005850 [Gnomoniopsis sp. IMI 355080]
MSSFYNPWGFWGAIPGYYPIHRPRIPPWAINPYGMNASYIGNEPAAQQTHRMLERTDPGINRLTHPIPPENHPPAIRNPWQGMRGDNGPVQAPPNTREANDIFVAAPMPQAPTRIEHAPADIRWRADDSTESEDVDDSDTDSDRTVTDWELDEEFVGLNCSDDSDVENDDASSSDAEMDIATLAPYAPRDAGTYSESVGEILTHESWQRVLAGIPPGMPLPHERQQGGYHANPTGQQGGYHADPLQHQQGYHANPMEHQGGYHANPMQHQQGYYANPMEQGGFYADPVLGPALSFEDDNIGGPNQAQLDDESESVAVSDQAQTEAENDIFGGTPPPVIQDDAYDADFVYGQAEAEDGGYPYENSDADAEGEDDDMLADIPPHKDDSEDDDFLPGNKRAPRRKAHGTASASARKQGRKPRGRAQGRVRPTPNASHSSVQMPGPDVPVANHAATASQAASANAGTSKEASDEAPLPGESVEQCAQRLQGDITELRGEITAAEARYEEAANNPRALTDPRTKKRRMAKLEEIRKKLTKAVEKQAQFEERCGLPRTQHGGNVVSMASTGSATVASSSTTPSAPTMQNRLQVLQQEVNKWQSTIQDLQRKVTHCQAQVNDVDANPHKFVNKRAGFKQGRITRLENAQHNLAHNLQMLADKQRLLQEEQQRGQEVASSSGQAGQNPQQQEIDQLQLLASQSSTPPKRKASQMHDEDEEEEEDMHARSKPRLC